MVPTGLEPRMPPDGDGIGPVGHPPAAESIGAAPSIDDRRWISLREALTPAETLTRVNANARATVGAVTVVGSLVTALGLVATQSLLSSPPAHVLAIASVSAAVGSIVLALSYLGLRLQRLRVRRLDLVKRWYERQMRRAALAIAASWLLVLAVLLGAAAGLTAVIDANSPPEPTIGLTLAGVADGRKLDVRVEVSGIRPGSTVTLTVEGVAMDGCNRTTVLTGRHIADRTGRLSIASSVEPLPCNEQFALTIAGDQIRGRSLTVPSS